MVFRGAGIEDIEQIQAVRNSVKENVLSNPSMVTDKDCEEYLTIRGKGWVCVNENTVVGFSIADLKENNIWALFVRPEYEHFGIGKKLHKLTLDWYFSQTKVTVWLGTEPNSRAEQFYKKAGWRETGVNGKGEIKFEMSLEDWNKSRRLSDL
jgi:GNAT superfamily N-acetyltransferase